MPQMIYTWCLLASALLFAAACDNSSFQGSSGSRNVALDASPDNEQQNDDLDATPPQRICDPEKDFGITSAEILTKQIPLVEGEKTIRYRIGLKDCFGELKELANVPILFDINSIINPFDVPAPYRIVSDQNKSEVLASGSLSTVLGSDLFGNEGQFAHWKTENVGVKKPEKSIILEVILDEFQLTPRPDLPETARLELPTYLKVSTAKAVQTNVKYSPDGLSENR